MRRIENMINQPRHPCNGRPAVCTGACNPRMKSHHHHHHHHRHHSHQKPYMTSDTMPKNVSMSPEFDATEMLATLKLDIPSIFDALLDDKSISKMPGTSTESEMIKVSSALKIPQRSRTNIAILRLTPSRDKVEMSTEGSNVNSPLPPENVSTGTPETTERLIREAPRILNNIKNIVTKRMNVLKQKRMPPIFIYLMILIFYAGIQLSVAAIAWQTLTYQIFVSSQICGILAFLMWKITGTILI